MNRFARAFALTAAMAGLMVAGDASFAPAQNKDPKTQPKDPKDTKTKVDETLGVAEVYMAKDGWRFRIKNTEGKSIAIGTVGFEKQEDALKAIENVKSTLTKTKVVVIKDDKK